MPLQCDAHLSQRDFVQLRRRKQRFAGARSLRAWFIWWWHKTGANRLTVGQNWPVYRHPRRLLGGILLGSNPRFLPSTCYRLARAGLDDGPPDGYDDFAYQRAYEGMRLGQPCLPPPPGDARRNRHLDTAATTAAAAFAALLSGRLIAFYLSVSVLSWQVAGHAWHRRVDGTLERINTRVPPAAVEAAAEAARGGGLAGEPVDDCASDCGVHCRRRTQILIALPPPFCLTGRNSGVISWRRGFPVCRVGATAGCWPRHGS